MNGYLVASLGADGWAAIIAATALAIVQIIGAWRSGAKANASLKLMTDTHTLVNSKHGLELEIYAIAAERIARLPDATETDRQAALKAKAILSEHKRKQAIVDQHEAQP